MAAPALSCITQDLLIVECRIFSCNMRTLRCGMWNLVPWPGIEPGPPALGVWNLTSRLPEKSLISCCACFTYLFLVLVFKFLVFSSLHFLTVNLSIISFMDQAFVFYLGTLFQHWDHKGILFSFFLIFSSETVNFFFF